MRESEIERLICEKARHLGISNLKLSGPGNRGQSDRMFMKNGRVAFLEVKAPGGVISALQRRFIDERRADGFAADVFDNVVLAVQWLRKELL